MVDCFCLFHGLIFNKCRLARTGLPQNTFLLFNSNDLYVFRAVFDGYWQRIISFATRGQWPTLVFFCQVSSSLFLLSRDNLATIFCANQFRLGLKRVWALPWVKKSVLHGIYIITTTLVDSTFTKFLLTAILWPPTRHLSPGCVTIHRRKVCFSSEIFPLGIRLLIGWNFPVFPLSANGMPRCLRASFEVKLCARIYTDAKFWLLDAWIDDGGGRGGSWPLSVKTVFCPWFFR